MLRSYLCGYSDACIVKGSVSVQATPNTDIDQKILRLKIMHHLDHA